MRSLASLLAIPPSSAADSVLVFHRSLLIEAIAELEAAERMIEEELIRRRAKRIVEQWRIAATQ